MCSPLCAFDPPARQSRGTWCVPELLLSLLRQLSLLSSCLVPSSTAPSSCSTSVGGRRQLLSASSGCAGLPGCHCLLLCPFGH